MKQVQPELRLSITLFMEVQHRVSIEGRLGPLHKHSCSVEVEMAPPPDNTIPFTELETHVRDQVSPFDGHTLNDLAEFQGINPSIENLAKLLFDRVHRVLINDCSRLVSLTVHESPTRSVKVVHSSSEGVVYDETPRQTVIPFGTPLGDLPKTLTQRPASDFEIVPEELVGARPEAGVAKSIVDPGERGHVAVDVILQPLEPAVERIRQSTLPSQARAWVQSIISPQAILPWAFVLAACLMFYGKIVWPTPYAQYPWGSDTWGHIAKTEFLLREISAGNWFPAFDPSWYNGTEPFRYWAPLPYYLLAALTAIVSDPFRAAGVYAALCALLGGLGWLAQSKRIGMPFAVAAACLWMIWPDHVRVAMAEGNLPRALATALFPFVFHYFLLVLERQSLRRSMTVLVILDALLVLTHAMIAAGLFCTLALLAVIGTVVGGLRIRDLVRGITVTFVGILSVAWWLLPAMRGGIASLNKEAVLEALDYFPLSVSFNPWPRLTNPEVFYWGLALVPLSIWALYTWKKRPGLARSAFVAGLFLVAVSTPVLRPLYNALPLSHMIWPLRLASAAPAMFFFAAFAINSGLEDRDRRLQTILTAALVALILFDSLPSTKLINSKPLPTATAKIATEIPSDGWRVATLDLSTLGSAATYQLGKGSREQVFGWASQGATTFDNIVWVNRALIERRWSFLFDRLTELGSTSIVVRRSLVGEYLDDMLSEARRQGFEEKWRSTEVVVLASGTKGPYALRTTYDALGIGVHTVNLAMMYPSIEIGASQDVDDYSLTDLMRYKTVIVAGADWKDKRRAEALLYTYVKRGGHLVINLQGLPEDVLSRRPSLFGVTGEPVSLYVQMDAFGPDGSKTSFMPFDSTHHPWKGTSPQGLTKVDMYFHHFNEQAALIGSKNVDGEDVWFVGGNLTYHAALTNDPVAIEVLSSVLRLTSGAAPKRQIIALSGYRAGAEGYRFAMDVPADGDGSVIIPVAARPNMAIRADGALRSHWASHNLVSIDVEPGRAFISIESTQPREQAIGFAISLVAVGLFYAQVFGERRGATRGIPANRSSGTSLHLD